MRRREEVSLALRHAAVIGAGFAGAIAAADLAAAGTDVLVLEARNRVGGRVWSRQMSDGLVVEMGAELIENWYVTMLDLVDRFGLPLVPGPERFRRFPFFDGGELVATQPDGIFQPVEAALERLVGLVGERSAAELDAMTVAAGLDISGLDGTPRRWFEALISGWSCREPAEESLLAFIEMRARPVLAQGIRNRRWARRLAGGNDQLATRLLDPLGARVKLNAQVRGLDWGPDRVQLDVTIGSTRTLIEVDAVILAIPFPALRQMTVTPALPSEALRTMTAIGSGLGAKAVIRYRSNASLPELFLSRQPRHHAWRSGDRPGASSVTLFTGGDVTRQLAALPLEQQRRTAVEWLGSSFPEAAAGAVQVEVAVWSADPLTGTCGTMYPPGAFTSRSTWLGDPIAATLYFAGEHTSADAFGSMEGALRTGKRAAAQLLADRS